MWVDEWARTLQHLESISYFSVQNAVSTRSIWISRLYDIQMYLLMSGHWDRVSDRFLSSLEELIWSLGALVTCCYRGLLLHLPGTITFLPVFNTTFCGALFHGSTPSRKETLMSGLPTSGCPEWNVILQGRKHSGKGLYLQEILHLFCSEACEKVERKEVA